MLEMRRETSRTPLAKNTNFKTSFVTHATEKNDDSGDETKTSKHYSNWSLDYHLPCN